MTESTKDDSLYYLASLALVASIILMLRFVKQPDTNAILHYAGWVTWAVGMVFLFWPGIVLGKQRMQSGESESDTPTLIDTGIYGVVRHPQYLGWLLMYVVTILFGQHWLNLALSLVGMICLVLYIRVENRRLVEEFGEPYQRYMERVPKLNILLGLIRRLTKNKTA
jgi:protein-S-isoprenylcysteine O-methyltransferase Ste14